MAERLCDAVIVFGDDHGDNECTFHCQLLEGHEGDHSEDGLLYNEHPYMYTVTWSISMPAANEEEEEE